jgi:hypothetical protein
MTTYADPTRCPDCSAPLPGSPGHCPRCALPLTGPTAVELFDALMTADRALVRLRIARAQNGEVQRPAAAATADPASTGGLLAGTAAYPVSSRLPLANRRRLSGASVPKILLSLGAMCLLVAAVTFLAVAWSWLGVGGRTTVVAVLTVVALGLSVVLQRRDLRMAAEALAVVGFGLLALDVVGAHHAGWLGDLGDGGLTFLTGALVSGVALVGVMIGRPRPLMAPCLIAPVALLVATAGATDVFDESLVPLTLSIVVLMVLASFGRTSPIGALTVATLTGAGVEWVALVCAGTARATGDQTVAHLWGELAIWPLVAAALLLAVVGPVLRFDRLTHAATNGVAALLASLVIASAALDNSLTAAAGTLAVLAAGWTVVLVGSANRSRAWTAVPLAGTLLVPVGCAVTLLESAASAVVGTGLPFTQPFDVHVADVAPAAAPWLLLPLLVVMGAAGCALTLLVTSVRRSLWARVLAAAVALGVVGTLPLYDVPLALVVGILVAVGLGLVAAADRTPIDPAVTLAAAAVVLTAASLAALPSDALAAAVLAAATTVAAFHVHREGAIGDVASVALPIALGGLDWAVGSWAGVPEVDRAAPLVLVLGALVIWRPRPELEVPAAVIASVASLAAVAAAGDAAVALALHLTLVGALVTTTSLVHRSRRDLAWAGALLLAAATWVRLWDVGVTTPEAYTLPSALVLVAVGMWRLRSEPRSSTVASLAPGLSLATVPSLLVALDAPASPRALLLGVACLLLVLLGTRLRWNAPLVVGATVGALLVLRELAPYAASVPPWLLIGLSGTLLTVVGVTWESRMQDLRHASRYVGELR